MQSKIIIFDMDGVIFDTMQYGQEYFLSIHPTLTEADYKELHAENYHQAVKKVAHLKIKRTEEEIEKMKVEYPKGKAKCPVFSGVTELLQELHQLGFILVLNTGAYEKNTTPLLEKHNIKEFFDFIATKETSESKVEKFKLIEKKYNLKNEDVLFITDALGDVKEAREAKIPTVGVTWGVHDRSFFEREKLENLVAIIDSPDELRKFILNYFKVSS